LLCDDSDLCTADSCASGECIFETVSAEKPAYLKIINPNKSWRKLKLGYSSTSLWNPKQDVIAGGNDTLCIILRDTSGSVDWNRIQVRPQGDGDFAVVLAGYLPPGGAVTSWMEICLPLSAFAPFDFTEISYLEIPYSQGSDPFEIHVQRVEFSGGAAPFLWFGGSKTDNFHDGTSADDGALPTTLIEAQPCAASKMSESPAGQQPSEAFVTAWPNPFSEAVNIEFMLAGDATVSVEMVSIEGSLVSKFDKGDVKGGQLYSLKFNTAQLPAGMYFYRLLASNGKIYTGKLVLQRQVIGEK